MKQLIHATTAVLILSAPAQSAEKPAWLVGPPVFRPGPPGAFDQTAVKDPTIVFFEGRWHLFYTARGKNEYVTGYVSAPELSRLQTAQRHELKQIRGRTGRYACAPQVFFFRPQKRWYLVYQTRDANYQPVFSTTTSIGKPQSWSAPAPLVKRDDGAKWIDFWIICDETTAYLFYTRAHRDVYVRTTPLAKFPSGWGTGEQVFSGVHEAVHIYRVKRGVKGGVKGRREYHMFYELSRDGRSLGLAKAESLAGPWQKVTDEYATGGQLRHSKSAAKWTEMVSHVEFLRSGYDQLLEYDSAAPRILIQGLLKSDYKGPYPSLPWKLGMITPARMN